ncbi:Sensor histidine kinase LiaS [Planctomycetes bacterium CA13]|uniref:histidine kinase n=1 Tax=Novipirellula herctigrandis TaxID=2527986 RepID=A0A5C5Z7U9_9BACT|nr:Sensor histidine kinase LiaS [Planctomycetes bacterium CA13]
MDQDELTRLLEMERASIGHEIHDALLPHLFAASAALQTMVDTGHPNNERLVKAAAWIDEAMQKGRTILHSAYPPELEQTPWPSAAQMTIEQLFDEMTLRNVTIDFQVTESAASIPRPVSASAYRITVEAIRNAIRHGNATEVVVQATLDNGSFDLVIRDNGQGFDPKGVAPDRFGLRSMKGRAEIVGGSFTVQSKPGGPTQIEFTRIGL